MYDDGSPARGALIAITSITSGEEVALVAADPAGWFEAKLESGEYALAVTAEAAFGWVETIRVPDLQVTITLSRVCHSLTGHVHGSVAGTQVELARKSRLTGDIFVANVLADGSFSACLPAALYRVTLRGPVTSVDGLVDLTVPPGSGTSTRVELAAVASDLIKQPPRELSQVSASFDGLVTDIIRRDPRLIGLGEATHGTAELVTARAKLTHELIRRADVRLVLLEVDAILATAVDDYVMGRDVDLAKAVAALGFWVTDTFELLQFFTDLRAHNATSRHKVRVWGVDVQDTKPPVRLLLASAASLKLAADDKAMLETLAEKRGARVRELAPARRAALDALLARLARPRTASASDLRIAVAARSLTVQLGYLDGDRGMYGMRRDAGMASLASFLVERMGTGRACVWAHAGHVGRVPDAGVPAMGQHLAAVASNRYYPIGFFVYEGSVRAWDAAGEVGVVSHRMGPAPAYTLEATVMAATGSPEIAWLPLENLPPALRAWTELPRYVREVGAVWRGEDAMLTLRDLRAAFEAIVVIKSGHDSSPTPTGVRMVKQ